VLVRELRRRPNDLVTYTYFSEEEAPERRDITVRELAEEQLKDMDAACSPALQDRVRWAL
jgi:hypothetical protein